MNFLNGINLFLSVILDSFRQVVRFRVWLFLLAYLLLQLLILYVHHDIFSPLFSGLIAAWTTFIDADKAMALRHYPQHFLVLGDFFSWAKLLVGTFFEPLVLGLVAREFARYYLPGEAGEYQAPRSFKSSYLHLVLVWIVINGLNLAADQFLFGLAGPWLDGPRRVMVFAYVLMPAIYIFVLTMFFYALPLVAVRGKTAWSALSRSVVSTFRHPFITVTLATLVLGGPLLLASMASRQDLIIERFQPETLYYLLIAGLVIEMVVNFFWMSASVRLLAEEE